jgi:hypothetical protein
MSECGADGTENTEVLSTASYTRLTANIEESRSRLDHADLIIVRSRDEDPFATVVAELATSHGLATAIATAEEFVASTSAALSAGQISLSRSQPLLLRWRGNEIDSSQADDIFLAGEIGAALRAYAVVCPSIVINRPSVIDFSGWPIHVPLLRGVLRDVSYISRIVRSEQFTCEVPNDHGWEVQDLGTLMTAYSPDRPAGRGPYRLRRGSPADKYLTAVVVGARSWLTPQTPDAQTSLASISIELARHLDLSFAAFVWNISAEFREPWLAKVEPVPSMTMLAPYTSDVAAALIALIDP